MNTHRTPRYSLSARLTASAVIVLALTACTPPNLPTQAPTAQPTPYTLPALLPTATAQVEATQPEEAQPQPAEEQTLPAAEPTQPADDPTQASASETNGVAIDFSDLAQGFTVETVAAVAPGADQMWWTPIPEHRVLTLQGYPVSAHQFQPKVYVYPLADLAGYNEAAGQAAVDLNSLLQTRQLAAGVALPFLPLDNTIQVTYTRVQFVDFKSGSGVRYLTQYNQGPVKLNNAQLVYTFQGLTVDGKYYIAAVLPVTHPGLPAGEEAFSENADDLSKYPNYVAETSTWLDQQPEDSFSPSLSALDALVQSIEVE